MNNIIASNEITDQTAMFQGLQFRSSQALLIAQLTTVPHRHRFCEFLLFTIGKFYKYLRRFSIFFKFSILRNFHQ